MDSGLRAGGQAVRGGGGTVAPEVEEQPGGTLHETGGALPHCKPPSTIAGGVLSGPSAKGVQAGDSTLEMGREGW